MTTTSKTPKGKTPTNNSKAGTQTSIPTEEVTPVTVPGQISLTVKGYQNGIASAINAKNKRVGRNAYNQSDFLKFAMVQVLTDPELAKKWMEADESIETIDFSNL